MNCVHFKPVYNMYNSLTDTCDSTEGMGDFHWGGIFMAKTPLLGQNVFEKPSHNNSQMICPAIHNRY